MSGIWLRSCACEPQIQYGLVSVSRSILDLMAIIDCVEAAFPFADIIESYNDWYVPTAVSPTLSEHLLKGTHPYLKYQESVLSLCDEDGEQFYGAMLDIIRHFECMYPHAVASAISLPSSVSLTVPGTRSHIPGVLPLEILERILALCGKAERFSARSICRDWCFAASCYTHHAIVFRMNTDWQYWVNTPQGKKDAELYAFAVEFVVLHIVYKWRFPLWVLSVSYFDWPTMPGPIFYRAFPNVRTVVFHGKSCRLRNYPVLHFPQVLLPSIESLRIVRCSLRRHSVEYMLTMCRNILIHLLALFDQSSVQVAPVTRSFDLEDACDWLSLTWNCPDFPHRPQLPDFRGTPPLLLQLFPDPPPATNRYFLWDDKVFPVCLCMSSVGDLEICLTPNLVYMLPRIIRHTGDTLSMLRLTFHEFIPLLSSVKRARNTYSFCLAGFTMLTQLHVEVNVQDLSHVLLCCASWSSLARGSAESAFHVVLLHTSGLAVQIEQVRQSGSFPSVLCAMDVNMLRPLKGLFQLSIRSPFPYSDMGPLERSVDGILEDLNTSSQIYAEIGEFTVDKVWDLLDLIDSVEMDHSLSDLVDSYKDGSHPYFRFQASMIDLVSNGGNILYSSLLQYLLDFESAHPAVAAVKSNLSARNSVLVTSTSKFIPSHFPPELLDRIFCYVPKAQLFIAHAVSQAWCFAASQYTHSKIVFHLRPNWQHFLAPDDEHKHEAEAYALVYQLALICVSMHWNFSVWVDTLVSENWAEIRVPFFFRALKNVHMVAICGLSTTVKHYPSIPSSYILPESVQSLHLFQCSLHRHSLESLISLCSDLTFLGVIGVHYGHVVVRATTLPHVAWWCVESGITTYLCDVVNNPPPPMIKTLRINFLDDLPRVLSTATDLYGMPPLLNQLFTPVGKVSCIEAFLEGVEVYPVRLRFGALESLDIRMSRRVSYVLPQIAESVGASLTGLHLFFPPGTRFSRIHAFTLEGFLCLCKLEASVSLQDLLALLHMCMTWSALDLQQHCVRVSAVCPHGTQSSQEPGCPSDF
ncbi:uncharacterized protein EV420DRAFT_1646814 [Desarmillaria tabescens]|uniref:F-box domain-containing protein n=1 Tax=Armillaria tabescens TaxID=1929756 RepID=A0AA39JYI1_ARMTA|nr:uncharacterized protein EV420DRAFT_1646814 [Desarmillaria tabescens]KAK0449814.1 hypothetical protein EV420DRAFT_1646814 [Desarmillaria tabescens]